MKPSELKNLIMSRFKSKVSRPVHIEGSPGMGKTEIAKQVSKELGVGFKVIHAPLLQPEDYGFPVIGADRKSVSFIVDLEKFPMVGSNCPESGILIIDDLAQADGASQKILRNLILEREIHGQKLKPEWTIITTGNRTTDRAGSIRLLSHLSNALTRIGLEISLDDWTQWALENGVKPEVVSFIRFRPALLNTFDAQSEVNATPRAWVQGVSASLGTVEPMVEFETFKGDVGEGPAAEFCGFLKICRDLPSVDAIMLDPTGVKVPKDGSTLYALCGALSHKATANNFMGLMVYVSRLPPEFALLFVKDATKLCPAILTTTEFIKWASKDGAKLLS